MQVILQQLADIELRIKDLAERYASLKQEHAKLIQLNTTLSNDLDQLREEKERLEGALSSALNDAKVSRDNDERQLKMKKELGQYIKEIDKCINLMQEI